MLFLILILNILLSVFCDDECGTQELACNSNSQYRTFDGSCNNLIHPKWGSIFSLYDRLYDPNYSDGKYAAPKAKSGNELPNARNITSTIFTEGMVETCSPYTVLNLFYGQFVVHDTSFTEFSMPPSGCCTIDFKFLNKENEPKQCMSIRIPQDDKHYSSVNASCISMARTVTNRDRNCSTSLKYDEQVSSVNAWLDLSLIYGGLLAESNDLRSHVNGTMKVEIRNGREWLPKSQNQRTECPGNLNSERCYHSGDGRANQSPPLLTLHLLFVRNHNRIARQLKAINPHWDDEKIYQEARRINIAMHQQITYYELLPTYFGRDNLIKRNIIYDICGYVNDYNSTMRPHVYNEHAQGAFRKFHSAVVGTLLLISPTGCPYNHLVLRDHILRSQVLEENEVSDGLIRGMAKQAQLPSDKYYDPTMTRFFRLQILKYGTDVKSIDTQRSRDHGIASYNDMRVTCGLKRAKNFSDLSDVMNEEDIFYLQLHYESIEDVELMVAGSLEKNEPGTLAGPTFNCIMYKQFYRTRISDRFFFESISSGFTPKQLREIRKFTSAKLLCDNGHSITRMQTRAFYTETKSNRLIPCVFIKGPNLRFWKE